jgi:hypothetical protein
MLERVGGAGVRNRFRESCITTVVPGTVTPRVVLLPTPAYL